NYIMREEKPMEIALATDNPYEVLDQAKNMNDIGCYFLDIQLSTDINGIKLGSEISKHDPVGNIIFVTRHSELTYLTFVYKAVAEDKQLPKLLIMCGKHDFLYQDNLDFIDYLSRKNVPYQFEDGPGDNA
ncbi:response regulator, partial [Staphylococcus aureus]|uniref:response regulator n=1 Tax=Staphylococcus aureus TaxID=1280 RepID=UPI00210C1F9B